MGVIIADLPDVEEITPDSYIIIEKPGVGEGTYKGTVENLQSDVKHDIEEIVQSLDNINSRLNTAEDTLAKVRLVLMWEGTREQWESLSESEKLEYKIVSIIDE